MDKRDWGVKGESLNWLGCGKRDKFISNWIELGRNVIGWGCTEDKLFLSCFGVIKLRVGGRSLEFCSFSRMIGKLDGVWLKVLVCF